MTVQSDDNAGFTSATTRITFTQISGGTESAENKKADGASTDDYWRVVWTIAGDGSESFTILVSVGIAPTNALS